jgi:hypothetical protein
LVVQAGCNNDGATLTALGQAAFPGLSDDNINENAGGECHNHFAGNRGSLRILAIDGDGLAFILGGGVGTTIGAGSVAAPIFGSWGLLAMTLWLGLAGGIFLRKRN